MLLESIDRWRHQWRGLLMAGLCANLLTMGLKSLPLLLTVQGDDSLSPADLLAGGAGLFGSLSGEHPYGGLILPTLIFFLVTALVDGGVLGTAAEVIQGGAAGLGTFWTNAWRRWWLMLRVLLSLLIGLVLPLGFLLVVIGNGLAVGLELGPLAHLVLGLLIGPPMLTAFYAGQYAAVLDTAGPVEALNTAWSTLWRHPVKAWTAGVVLLLGSALLYAMLVEGSIFLMESVGAAPAVVLAAGLTAKSLALPLLPTLYIGLTYQRLRSAD